MRLAVNSDVTPIKTLQALVSVSSIGTQPVKVKESWVHILLLIYNPNPAGPGVGVHDQHAAEAVGGAAGRGGAPDPLLHDHLKTLQTLVSVSTVGTQPGLSDEQLEEALRAELGRWWGSDAVGAWRHLRTYRIPFAQPNQVGHGQWARGKEFDRCSFPLHCAFLRGRSIHREIGSRWIVLRKQAAAYLVQTGGSGSRGCANASNSFGEA